MKREFKKVYGYALIMVVVVMLIVLIVCLSEAQNEKKVNTYKAALEKNKSEVELLQDKVKLLESEKGTLETEKGALEIEKGELESQLKTSMDIQAKADKHNQIMGELTEVYNFYKDGETTKATEKLESIDSTGFDDGELAFCEALKVLLAE